MAASMSLLRNKKSRPTKQIQPPDLKFILQEKVLQLRDKYIKQRTLATWQKDTLLLGLQSLAPRGRRSYGMLSLKSMPFSAYNAGS